MSAKKILITDDHPLLLVGLRGIISEFGNYELVGEATNGDDSIRIALETKPDICFLDLEIPGASGMDVLKRIKSELPECKVAILTSHKDEQLLLNSIDAGADGYLLKDFANNEIERCLNHFKNDEPYYSEQLKSFIHPAKDKDINIEKLSRTEKKILKLIAQEKTSKEIAEILFISPKTVDNHRSNIIKKLDIVAKKHSLFSWALKHVSYL